jgi:hypothetical protein
MSDTSIVPKVEPERYSEDYRTVHHYITYDGVVDRETVEAFIKEKNRFGWHEVYGGCVYPLKQKEGTHWDFQHSASCD